MQEKDPSKITIAVGMSGGVDSSVSALLLKRQGYNVIGMFMKNWEEDENCPAEKDYEDVVKVCEKLQIPCYSINFAQQYWDHVFMQFTKGLKAGLTPNPDILCNKEIKFKLFLEKAKSIGADALATGHYCQKKMSLDGWQLVQAKDLNKDQTYFVYTLNQKILDQVYFPIGHLLKSEVRCIAQKIGLANHDKKDSTGICFIGKRNFKDFIGNYIHKKRGNFVDENGQVIAEHDGLGFYTIGQRKGLNIGGAGEAWYVAEKNIQTNEIILVQGADHPMLYKKFLKAGDLSWVGKEPSFPLHCTAKIRYRTPSSKCLVSKTCSGELIVEFEIPQKAITPSQSIVFYKDDVCLGGAIIK